MNHTGWGGDGSARRLRSSKFVKRLLFVPAVVLAVWVASALASPPDRTPYVTVTPAGGSGSQ